MKKSELVLRLQKDIEKNGDGHLRFVKLVDLCHGEQSIMLSPTRVNKNGTRAYMNQKEMVEYCKNNPILNKEKV